MTSKKHLGPSRPVDMLRKMLLMAAVGGFAFPLSSTADVEHTVLDIEDALGVPAIQAVISACLGEEVLFTGTVRITTVDGVATHFNWSNMRGETLDGDVFVGGSGVNTGTQSNLTLTEIGSGSQNRLIHLQIVDGVASVVCHA